MTFYSRISLRTDHGSTGTLIDILRRDRGLGGQHRLVWTLFSKESHAQRDFVFRQSDRDTWLVLSQREPVDAHHIWDITTKPFEPKLHAGQRLYFRLRANPRVSVRSDTGKRVKHDVIQHTRMSNRAADGTLPALADVLLAAAHEWLSTQGDRAGFAVSPDQMVADCYVQQEFPRDDGGRVSFRSLDYRGILSVTDPGAFIPAVQAGFGGGRAYGFGMMLLSRV